MYNDLFTVFGLTVHGYGLMIGLGFLMAVTLCVYRAGKLNLSADIATDIALIAIVSGFLGAKILYIIVEFDTFLVSPMSVIGSEGFVAYGGIILGVLSIVLYCKRKKVNFLEYFDLMMPGVSLAQGMGRIGCFMAGCCYGRETDSCLGVIFPKGSIAPAGVKLLPTQLFSAAGDFAIAAILLLYSRHSKRKGDVGCGYLVLYGVGRFIIEFFRNDPRGNVGVLSTSQFISIFITVVGIALYFINRKVTPQASCDDAAGVCKTSEVSEASAAPDSATSADVDTAPEASATNERTEVPESEKDAE